jgi:hypothetical protein
MTRPTTLLWLPCTLPSPAAWTAPSSRYTKSSGKYKLADMDNSGAIAYPGDAVDCWLPLLCPAPTPRPSRPAAPTCNIDPTGGALAAAVAANADTKFVFVKTDTEVDDYTYSTYTGIKNVPDVKLKAATMFAWTMDDAGKYAEFVVVYDGKTATSATDEIVFGQWVTRSKTIKDSSHR